MLSTYQRLSLLVQTFTAGQTLFNNAIVIATLPDIEQKQQLMNKLVEEKDKFAPLLAQVLAETGPVVPE